MDTKYPEITVRLSGADGNAGVIVGYVARALKGYGVVNEEIDEFRKDAYSGDYDHLLRTAMAWVNVE